MTNEPSLHQSFYNADDTMTEAQQDAQDALEALQLTTFFSDFSSFDRECQLEIADEILQGEGWVISLMRERAGISQMEYDFALSNIAHHISMKEEEASNKVAYDIINAAAEKWAETQIENNAVTWEY